MCVQRLDGLKMLQSVSLSVVLLFLSACQSASGSGPLCGFNPTLPWLGSKDNEVPEVGTQRRREKADIMGWSVVSRNIQNCW